MRPETFDRKVWAHDFKVGDHVICIDAHDHYPAHSIVEGGRYIVSGHAFNGSDLRLEGVRSTMCAKRFLKVAATAPISDLDRMKDMLTRAGVRHASWRIGEYVLKDNTHVVADGFVLVHGAEDDGPYTEYLFDPAGNIIPNGATSYYVFGTEVLETA